MARYFKIIEITREEFVRVTSEDLDCNQLVAPAEGGVFVAIDDCEEYEINDIPLEMFDEV